MENEKQGPEPVPYLTHEAALARMERCNRRLVVLIAILAAVLVVSLAVIGIHVFA